MRRIVLICAALIASLALTIPASARLGMAPLSADDGSLIQMKGMATVMVTTDIAVGAAIISVGLAKVLPWQAASPVSRMSPSAGP